MTYTDLHTVLNSPPDYLISVSLRIIIKDGKKTEELNLIVPAEVDPAIITGEMIELAQSGVIISISFVNVVEVRTLPVH